MRLLIASSFYEIKAYSPYVESLFRSVKVLTQEKIEVDYLSHPGDAYVDRSKNTLCAKFLESSCSDLLIIDSDLAWDDAAILRLLRAPYEIVGAVYPMKLESEVRYPCSLRLDGEGRPVVDKETGLLAAEWLPGGFLRIKRSVLEKMSEAYKGMVYREPNADPTNPGREYVPFFECVIDNGIRCTEDYIFCKRWKDIGGKLWIEPKITFGHYGLKAWYGSFHHHLLEEPDKHIAPVNRKSKKRKGKQ